MQSVIHFSPPMDNALKLKIGDVGESLNSSNLFYDNVSFNYVSILSGMVTQNFVIISLLAIFDMLLILPSNLLTVIVIVRNKELWTPSNIVLSINGTIQCIGTAVYLVVRFLWVYVMFLAPMNSNYKESVYMALWWTYTLMMRTGNNRLVK